MGKGKAFLWFKPVGIEYHFLSLMEKIVQHMQGICFQETPVAVCFTDSLEPNAFDEWKANLKQIKNNASIQIYLLSGSKATEIPI